MEMMQLPFYSMEVNVHEVPYVYLEKALILKREERMDTMQRI
jgi:hypothetical protein